MIIQAAQTVQSIAQVLWNWLWPWAWQSAVVIALVLVARQLIFRGALLRWRGYLWLIVPLHMLLPVHPQARISIFNFLQPAPQAKLHADAMPASLLSEGHALASHRIIRYGTLPAEIPSATPNALPIPAQSATTPQPHLVLSLLVFMWLCGAVVMMLRGFYMQRRFHLQLQNIQPSDDPRLLPILKDAAAAMGVAKTPDLIITDKALSPAVTGLLHSRLLLSPVTCAALDSSQLHHVFLHEMAHLQRRDLWIDQLCALLLAAQWFNPLGWLALSLYRADREIARDFMVMVANGSDQPQAYGRTIIALLEQIAGPNLQSVAALGMLEPRSGLRQRLVCIADYHQITIDWRYKFVAVAALTFIAAAALTSCKQSSTTPQPSASVHRTSPAALETRTYDIADLMTAIPDFESPTLAGIPPTSQPTKSDNPKLSPQQRLDALVQGIRKQVDPASWSQGATIRASATKLVISQTPHNHQRIAEMMDEMHQNHGIEITVAARFIELDPDKLKSQSNLESVAPEIQKGAAILNNDEVDALLKMPEMTALNAPRMTLFNGQRAYVLFGDEQNYVKDFKAVAQPSGPTKYEPVISTLQTGALLDCQAMASADRKYVTLRLYPQISALRGMMNERWAGSPPGRNDLNVQVPVLDASFLNTTVSIPDGSTMLMALTPGPATEFAGSITLNVDGQVGESSVTIGGAATTAPATSTAAATAPARAVPVNGTVVLGRPSLPVTKGSPSTTPTTFRGTITLNQPAIALTSTSGPASTNPDLRKFILVRPTLILQREAKQPKK